MMVDGVYIAVGIGGSELPPVHRMDLSVNFKGRGHARDQEDVRSILTDGGCQKIPQLFAAVFILPLFLTHFNSSVSPCHTCRLSSISSTSLFTTW